MKRKLITLLSLIVLILSITGCSSKTAANLPDDSRELEDLGYNKYGHFEEESEEEETSTVPKLGYKIKNKSVPNFKMETSGRSNIASDCLARVWRFVNAYKAMITSENELAKNIQIDIESRDIETVRYHNDDLVSMNNEKVTDNYQLWALAVNYYYDYSNYNINQFMDYGFALISEPKIEDTVNKYLKRNFTNENYSNAMLLEAIPLADYLYHCENISAASLKKDESYVISNVTSKYVLRLNCDEDYNLIAIFDKDCNLLNIMPDNSYIENEEDYWNEYLYTSDTYNSDLEEIKKNALNIENGGK